MEKIMENQKEKKEKRKDRKQLKEQKSWGNETRCEISLYNHSINLPAKYRNKPELPLK
jgi:hypothetical protein